MSDEKKKTRGRIKSAIASTAPKIAEALGGPLAGSAVSALSRAIFGSDGASEDAIDEALKTLSSDQAAALVKAEMEFQTALANANVEETRIHAGDRANARARQQAMNDWTPSALGGLIILGFFIVLGAMVTRSLPSGFETEFSIMLGALATMTAAVVNYFFGSSLGSKEKTRLMSLTGRKNAEE
ncbi:MAG TPA: hypothetical protein PK585_01290 [Amphiplicatus sp.]|nr:hypothetical protein [Amphiplicatus sp.]